MLGDPKQSNFHFDGFDSPNGTIVPDDVFDVLMPRLTDPELRVLLYIIRRTFGFKKQSDNISLRQMVEGITTRDGRVLDGGTGMSKASVARGIKGLTQKGVIIATHNSSRERGNEPTTYALRFKRDGVSHNETRGVSQDELRGLSHFETRGSSQNETGPVSPVDPQQTARQQTEEHHSNLRKNPYPTGMFGVDEQGIEGLDKGSDPLSQVSGETQPPRPPRVDDDPDRDVILEYISDFSREFRDRASLRSSTTRAYNLYRQSELPIETFIEGLYRARSIVKERSEAIRSADAAESGLPAKRKMAYFFAVLEDLLGLRDASDDHGN